METTCSFIDGNTLYECINNKIDVDRILAHIEKMNQLGIGIITYLDEKVLHFAIFFLIFLKF